MKQVSGVFLPDGEAHMPGYLRDSGGLYQNSQLQRSLDFVAGWNTALDIGAHVGLWSKALVQRFSRVVAFEPLPQLRACLERNVMSDRLQVVPMALGNDHGCVAFDYNEAHTGETHVAAGKRGLIPLGKLDDFKLEGIDYVKIDVEGFELSVLQGAEATLRANQPIIIVEEKMHGAKHFGQQPYAAIRFLESLGAVVLDRVVDDLILGWPDTPGKVRPAAPASPEQVLAAAIARHNAQDVAGAHIAYRMLLRNHPAVAEAWNMLGVAELQLDRPEDATQAARRAIALAPREARFHNTLGAGLWLAGRSGEAVEAVEYAVKLQPTLVESHLNLGEMRETLGQIESALACYEAVARLRPNSPEALLKLGRVHASHGSRQQASNLFRRALALQPNLDEASRELAALTD
jgi:FkbM family methyltransferase